MQSDMMRMSFLLFVWQLHFSWAFVVLVVAVVAVVGRMNN